MYCRTIKKISNDIKEWIFYQPNVSEESITDRLLYILSRKVPGIYYKGFTRIEEGRKTGADWEWWIIFRDGSYRFRVQAKKEKSDNYLSLLYTNTHGRQIEMLIDDADKVNAIPLYSFYSTSDEPSMCRKGFRDEGVFLSSAKELYDEYVKRPRRSVDIGDIIGRSNPLTCFFCCPLIKGTASGFKRYLDRYYGSIFHKGSDVNDNSEDNNKNVIGYHEDYPEFLDQLMNDDTLPDWLESEFRYKVQGIGGILVVDMRDLQDEN